MTAHTTSTMTTHLHGDVVDVELLSVRSGYRELHILVGRVVLGLHPCTALAGAHHDTLLGVIAIFHHTLHLGGSGCGLAVDSGIVVALQSPVDGERIATTQFDGVHRHVGSRLLVAHRGGHRTIKQSCGGSVHLGIESFDDRSALVAHLQCRLPVLFVGRQQDTFRGVDGDGAGSWFQS